jgi:hypothetical protein
MKHLKARAIVVLAALVLSPLASHPQAKGANINKAESRFRLGEFTGAGEMAAAVLAKDPTDFRAALLQGRVALLGNRLAEAESWVRQAAGLRPTHRQPREMLAEIHYRRDEFARAAELLAGLGQDAKAAQLGSFGNRSPYRGAAEIGRIEVSFVQTDPLPVIRISVNGSEPAAFLIDTGGAEVLLDTEWAAAIGVETFGEATGTFGGGRKATYGYGRANSLTLGEATFEDIPVHLLDTTPFSAVAPGEEIRGVLGTVFLYHFLATIDYPGGRLVLERRGTTEAASEPPEARVPFWMAGDHFLLAHGRVNDSDETLFFVDTGLAGLGFTGPQSTLDEANVELIEAAAGEGIGGGGAVRIVPFVLESLSLGRLRRQQIPGVFGPFPPTLEHDKGFRIGGLISHGFFRPYAITLDFDAMELRVRSPEG